MNVTPVRTNALTDEDLATVDRALLDRVVRAVVTAHDWTPLDEDTDIAAIAREAAARDSGYLNRDAYLARVVPVIARALAGTAPTQDSPAPASAS